MTHRLITALSAPPHNLRVLAFSTDDLYLPFQDQEALRQKFKDNHLLEFRGLPGTHDIQLGESTLRALCDANEQVRQAQGSHTAASSSSSGVFVSIPSYDKALHSGRGDQVPRDQWPRVEAPIDVVLFEGWSLGFKSIHDPAQLQAIYQQHSTFPPYYLAKHPFSSIETVNRLLEAYEREWYSYLDVFVHLSAPNLTTIFKWRAEQERDLWMQKGKGMTEEQVKEFVSRFMPAYEVYLSRLEKENVFRDDPTARPSSRTQPWIGRHLRVNLNEERDLVSTTPVE
ncbi:hypothetical protein BGZ98_002741 [Dissophora globulifera]|nr:hypothetical protein BGZ98_002741 [Dissophora globulifera]